MMHTVKVIAAGFALLLVCVLLGPHFGAVGLSALVFIPVWFVCAGINMWFGVTRAGYSVKEELPVFFVVFVVPVAAALLVYLRYAGAI